MQYPEHLLKLINQLKKLPGVGGRTAERFAFHMLEWSNAKLQDFAETIRDIPSELRHCPECGCLSGKNSCALCDLRQRLPSSLCIVATSKDVFAIESTGGYRGLYHVLGGLLSPLEGRNPDFIQIQKVKERIVTLGVKEVIIALDSTLEGDATSLYLKKEIEAMQVDVSRLAFGLPMGSPLDYVDGGTLAQALSGRRAF